MKKFIIISIVILVAAAGSWWFFFKTDAQPSQAEMNQQQPPPQKIPVDVGEVKNTIYATGSMEAEAREEVDAEVNGEVENIAVEEGQTVEEGDLLYTIDDEDAVLEYEQQKISVEQQEQELKKLKENSDEIVASEGGKVEEISIEEEDEVTRDQVVVKVSKPDQLLLNQQVYHHQVDALEVGQSVRVFLPDSLTYTEGVITDVVRQGEATDSGTIVHDVEVEVQNPGGLSTSHEGRIEFKISSGETVRSAGAVAFEKPEQVELKAEATGEVEKVNVEKGDIIDKGNVIATLDTSQTKLDRREMELNLQKARNSLQQMARDLEKYDVYAPISGEATEVNIEEGDQAEGSEPAVVIMDQSQLYMVASVNEMDIPAIETGQNVDVYITAFGGQVFSGKVAEVPEEGTVEDGEDQVRFEVKVLIEDSESGIKPGMTGDCDIIVERVQDVPRLPFHAVQIVQDGQGTVMVMDEESEQPQPKQVEIGVEGMEYVEIKSGLSAGDEVVQSRGGRAPGGNMAVPGR